MKRIKNWIYGLGLTAAETLAKVAVPSEKMGDKGQFLLTEPKTGVPGESLVPGGPIAVDEIRVRSK